MEGLNFLNEEDMSSWRDVALLEKDSTGDAGAKNQSSSTAVWEGVKRLEPQLALPSGGEDKMLRLSG